MTIAPMSGYPDEYTLLPVDLCLCCGEQSCRDLDCTTCEDCGAPWGQAHANGCPREEERNG